MNVTELREELASRAHELDHDFNAAASFMPAGVARKVTGIRRRRAGGVAGAVVAAALVVGATVASTAGDHPTQVPAGPNSSSVPSVTLGADRMPVRVVGDSAGDVIKDGLRYRSHVADDRLAAGFIGDRGQGQFSLLWEPTTTHVSVDAECYLPGLTDAEAAKYMVSVSLGGAEGFLGSLCAAGRPTERDLPVGGAVPGEPGQGWSELTVGQSARVRVQLVDAKTSKPASVDGAQLTGAVYELGTQQVVEDETGRTVAALPTVVEHQGYRYRISGISSGALASGSLPEVGTASTSFPDIDVPRTPFLVSWGSAGKDLTGGAQSGDGEALRLDGLQDSMAASYGSWSVVPVPAGSTRSLRLVAEGPRPDHGTAFIAIYTPEK